MREESPDGLGWAGGGEGRSAQRSGGKVSVSICWLHGVRIAGKEELLSVKKKLAWKRFSTLQAMMLRYTGEKREVAWVAAIGCRRGEWGKSTLRGEVTLGFWGTNEWGTREGGMWGIAGEGGQVEDAQPRLSKRGGERSGLGLSGISEDRKATSVESSCRFVLVGVLGKRVLILDPC